MLAPDLDPYYVNQRRIGMLVGPDKLLRALGRVPQTMNEKQRAQLEFVSYKELLREYLQDQTPPSFEVARTAGKVRPGLFFTVFRDLTCRALVGNTANESKSLVYAKYDASGDFPAHRLELTVTPDHVLPGSCGELLSGKVADLFAIGVVNESTEDHTVASPLFIGRILIGADSTPQWGSSSTCEVMPEKIDSFSLMASEPRPQTSDLNTLKKIPEIDVKRAIAEILGDDVEQKDWGGERSDLFTTEVVLEGKRTPTAFVLKGPSKFRKMTLSVLGKNGDQLNRLATEPADLLVVQHCHQIDAQVRVLMRAICNQIGSFRRFALIDGYDTLRLLRAYSKCGLNKATSSSAASPTP